MALELITRVHIAIRERVLRQVRRTALKEGRDAEGHLVKVGDKVSFEFGGREFISEIKDFRFSNGVKFVTVNLPGYGRYLYSLEHVHRVD